MKVRFYYRDGCHLCEECAAALMRGWPGLAEGMEWRDVDGREKWRAAYGDKVPVLVVDGVVFCAGRPDQAHLAEYFGDPLNPL